MRVAGTIPALIQRRTVFGQTVNSCETSFTLRYVAFSGKGKVVMAYSSACKKVLDEKSVRAASRAKRRTRLMRMSWGDVLH
jgi:hypothetical protein